MVEEPSPKAHELPIPRATPVAMMTGNETIEAISMTYHLPDEKLDFPMWISLS